MAESFAWGIPAGSSLVLGGIAALLLPISRRLLGIIMAFGAGVLISAVAFELVNEAFETTAGDGGLRSASSPDPVSSSSETRSSTASGLRTEIVGWQPAMLEAETGSFVEVQSLRAKLALADGDAEAARAATEAGIKLVGPKSCYSAGIELWLLDGLARRELRERAESRASLEHALELAAPDHYRRVFLSVGPAARSGLVELVREGTAYRSFVAELIAAFDRRAPQVSLTHSQLLEPLSDREKAILRYLPTMMSNVEIAGELYLSINTVKTHLRHVYRKLGVSRRRDAVERARQLSLL